MAFFQTNPNNPFADVILGYIPYHFYQKGLWKLRNFSNILSYFSRQCHVGRLVDFVLNNMH